MNREVFSCFKVERKNLILISKCNLYQESIFDYNIYSNDKMINEQVYLQLREILCAHALCLLYKLLIATTVSKVQNLFDNI